jgi:hypothetical protein
MSMTQDTFLLLYAFVSLLSFILVPPPPKLWIATVLRSRAQNGETVDAHDAILSTIIRF